MKSFLILALLITTSAFADICSFEDVYTFSETMKAENNRPYKITNDMKKLSSVEKELIHRTVSLETWRGPLSVQEAIEVFFDFWEGKPGTLQGYIEYYKYNGKKIVLVSYFPGDNEYGAFFVENKLIAKVNDSDIYCK